MSKPNWLLNLNTSHTCTILTEKCFFSTKVLGLHSLSAIPCDSLRRPVRNSRHSDSDTFTILSSRVDSYKYSFFPRTISEWNKLPQDVRSKPSVASFRSALLRVPGPVEINFFQSHSTPAVTDIRPSPDI